MRRRCVYPFALVSMARPKKSNLTVVPPTKKQCSDILFQLRQGRFLEHACLLAGVSLRVLNKWIELGRKNTPGYVEFTDAIDRADAELGDKLMTGVMKSVEDGDPGTLKWLYDKRLAAREKHMQQKWIEQEQAAYTADAETADVVSLEEAEKALEESLLASDGELH